jgi:predicted NBD/HSP70 family sugar kinase
MNELNLSTTGQEGGKRDSARLRILEALRRAGPLSRAALGRANGMSPASVSSVTAGLLADGVLRELPTLDGEATAGPGRPGTRLGFDPDVGLIIGLWVGLDRIALQATDYVGRTVALRDERAALSRLSTGDLLDALAARTAAFRAELAPGRVLGLGVAFQGFVDQTAGRVVWSPVTASGDLPVVEALSGRLGLPVELDNDASAMAFAIMRGDRALQTGVTACVMLGDGVGLGVFVDGQPLRGARGGGMEFGHVRLHGGGPQCRCGRRGCIESYLADYALYRDAMAVSDLAPAAERRQPSEAEMAALAARAQAGEQPLVDLFADAGRVLAEGATMLIHLFQPEALVFCGPGARAFPLMEETLRRGVEENAIPRLRRSTRIEAAPFRPELLTEGMVLRALDSLDRRLAGG